MAAPEQPSAPTLPAHDATVHEAVSLPLGSSNNIRLLKILDDNLSDDTEPISCELHLASLDESYVALSYMWGEEAASKIILLNGRPFLVRQNLWDFLHQARLDQARDGKTQYLWIDALCIDQVRIAERNHQVAMMGAIYSKASGVLIWLGAGTETLIEALSYLEDFVVEDHPALGVDFFRAPVNSLHELFTHPYWFRAWIIQECVLAVELQLQCGSVRILHTALMRYLGRPKIMEFFWSRTAKSPWIGAEMVLIVREKWLNALCREYIDPWDSFGMVLNCTDVRDRVYAMIAIMDPAINIIPDYNKSTRELFVELVDGYIIHEKDCTQNVQALANTLGLVKDPIYHQKYQEAEVIDRRNKEAKDKQPN